MPTEAGHDPVYMRAVVMASEIGVKIEMLRHLASLKDDPLPIRYLPGMDRSGFVIVSEATEWIKRNGSLYAERNDRA